MPIYTYDAGTGSIQIVTGDNRYEKTIIYNHSIGEMRLGIGLGNAESLTSTYYSFPLPPSGIYETDYKGSIYAQWTVTGGSGIVTQVSLN